MSRGPTRKSEETRTRIFEAALAVFRERGFERATMREIAPAAEVALGAAYYYFDSKEAIVMAFYERAQMEMKPVLSGLLDESHSLEERLRRLIQQKFDYFDPNRRLLGALSAHADPEHPLSPFSSQTAHIRNQDISFFERAVSDSRVKLPANIQPYLPRLLWMYQMGLILFWVYDQSPAQKRTALLFDRTLKVILIILKIAGIPLLRPVHRLVGEALEAVYGSENGAREKARKRNAES
jgi:AcrR family transcriptional regulator